MSSSSPSLLHFSLFFLLLHQPLSASLTLPKSTLFRPNLISEPTPSTTDTPITTYFEVTKPIEVPHTKPCSYLLLRHDFAYTYSKPPVLANYTPPSDCPSQDFAKIVLEWTATSKGRQFDRIFGVWLGGVELLRSCTAEPRSTGTIWTVQKDITRYYSLLMTNQTLAVYLGNLVDSTYTGVYHVDISDHFHPAAVGLSYDEANLGNSADLILPVSRNLTLNDGLWFEIENSTDVESKKFEIPRNAYRALLEVYVSFHENDESWYTNLLNEYISANNLTGTAGNGAFREVVVRLDGTLVGAVWPFTVIYTGGVNPLLWRPITGIGSFNLPSYDIEITPFLGSIVDGKIHEFTFSVTNALNVWYIDANLHVWLDKTGMETEGQLLSHTSLEPVISLVSNFTGPNGNILISSSRSVSSIGWVKSSLGNITTNVTQTFNFSNFMVMGNHGNLQIVNQIIDFNNSVHALMPTSTHSIESFKRFLLYLYSNSVDQGNDTSNVVTNLTLGFSEERVEAAGFGFLVSSLKNLQNAQGIMLVKGNLVVSGIGSTQQAYQYDGSKFCYFRTVSSSNYSILYDKVGNTCSKNFRPRVVFGLAK
ncbi:peptide-N4-(N-acetyl-beta-glucosaminyl)asparagine amidase A-like [Rhododendron vialii]|uniref:peptide-N4-(N-acetyl-beta- glucosaminyl)asparagine amidase A-like n=1 Tax=Rhododendron vialii TaxID=182163 RepID=UPI00265E6AC3|nr:peptide-N4-(N-acetyl-beta-glucosaminyl)asparagine amidase A-like [Rhododendron vialii]